MLFVPFFSCPLMPFTASPCPPPFVPFPVLILLPSTPVSVEISISYSWVFPISMAIVRRKFYQYTGNSCRGNIGPRSVIASRPEPAAFVRAIPEAMVKDDINVRFRRKIGVCPGDNYEGRRRGKRNYRDINANSYTYARIAL
jgi:hypothetical protein